YVFFTCELLHFYCFFFLRLPHPLRSTLFPYTTLFRSTWRGAARPPAHARPPQCCARGCARAAPATPRRTPPAGAAHRRSPRASRSEEHTSELQSLRHLVCRLLLEKKKTQKKISGPRSI